MGEHEKAAPTGGRADGKPSLVLVTALIAAAAPLTVAIHEWIAKSKELELAAQSKQRDFDLAKQDQTFKTETWFLQNAVDPQKTPELRQQVLRFIEGGSEDANLKTWAKNELARVDEVVALRASSAVKDHDVESLKKQVADLREAAAQKPAPGHSPAEIAEKKTALKDAMAAQKKAEHEALVLRRQLALKGARPPGEADDGNDDGVDRQKAWQRLMTLDDLLAAKPRPLKRAPDPAAAR